MWPLDHAVTTGHEGGCRAAVTAYGGALLSLDMRVSTPPLAILGRAGNVPYWPAGAIDNSKFVCRRKQKYCQPPRAQRWRRRRRSTCRMPLPCLGGGALDADAHAAVHA